MQLLPWFPGEGEGLLVYAGMLLIWAQALYVITRGGRALVPMLAALAMAMLAAYLLGLWEGALSFPAAPSRWVAWVRGTWWAACLAPALWLTLAVVLAAEEGPTVVASRLRRYRVWLGGLCVGTAAAISLVGIASEAVLRWSETRPMLAPFAVGPDAIAWHVPPGPLYPAYQVYLLAMLLGAVGVLGWLWRLQPNGTPLRARFGGLLAAGGLFLLGGAYLAFASAILGASAVPGEILLVAGTLMLGWNIARYGALLSGEVDAADFRAFCLSTLALVALYSVLILAVPVQYAWPEGARWLLLIVMTTHVLADPSSTILDRLLFEPATSALRLRLRQLANQTSRQPDAISALSVVRSDLDATLVDTVDGEQLRNHLEGALKHLNNLPALTRDALVGNTPSTAHANVPPMDAAILLRNELVQAIERLRPSTPRPTPGGSAGPGGWLHYLVLYEAYVDGRHNKEIMQRYYLSESTFHRARRSAVNSLAADLHERLVRTGAAAPGTPESSLPRR
jgi:hypothetical protein